MPTGSFANSFMAAKDYAEQERAKGREPSQRELAMVASAGQDDPMFALKRQMIKNQANADALKITAQQKMIELENKKLEGLDQHLNILSSGDLNSTDTLNRVLMNASRFGLGEEVYGPAVSSIQNGIKLSRMANSMTTPTPDGMEPKINVDPATGASYKTFSSENEKTRPADLVVLEEAEKYDNMAERARLNQDPSGYKRYKAMAEMRRATLTKAGGTTVALDDNGRPVVTVGGQVPLSVTSESMKKETSNLITMSELNKLDSSLLPEHVGIAGMLNENVKNKGLAQFFPEMFDPSSSDSRYLIRKVMEGTIKAFASDSRITDKDAERIKKMLPDTGALNSYGEIKNSIKNVRASLKTAMRQQAHISRRAIPQEAMEPVELKDFYNAQIKRLESDVEESKESREVALEKLKVIQANYSEALKAATQNAN
jgi:hypothetical protein